MAKDPSAVRPPRPSTGLLLAVLGGCAMALTTPAHVPWPALYATEAWAYQVFLGGAGAAVVGLAWSLWAVTRPPPPKPEIEAHVAFMTRKGRAFDPLADTHFTRFTENPGLARTKPRDTDLSDLRAEEHMELRIDEVKERIARAKVEWGTGRISDEMYAELMERLKKELARLEADRVDAQLAGVYGTDE